MYLLDIDKLETGDIILTRSNSDISQLVRRLTKSEFSHAILYVGVSSCIDSDGYGVQSQNIQRLLYENKSDVKVLRLKETDDRNEIPNAIVFARQKIGTEYSIDEAKVALLKKEIEAKEPNRQFCTRFVAQAFESAGIRLVENPDYCNPEELLKSQLLIEVEDPLRKANDAEIEFANSESPLKKQQEIHNMIFNNARKLSGADIQTFEQLSKYVLENPDKEPEITKIIKDSGYLTMWQMDTESKPWHYDSKLFVEYYKHPRQIVDVALFFATTEKETRNRFEITLEALEFGYLFYQQEYFAIQIELYHKLIELSLQRELTALKVLKG
jgi:Permuted papain-like amidase enzyme, YaeF/YiiX, C92 family